ncbi:hypothetical protein V8B55DRAFT_1500129 [Mucor lusitanicus]|uniref:Uncharacterized protein n=2 Tax=Mucor circinelloides f. lusitanicus TaxID=29924 RepID=A0A168MZZ4_MUCCL|nr:hypothetical protein FB192DRAFT_1433036 [Mucor lusitanicus]OAD05596.1 hypothetical protein MUCCIDRAFT_155939 [Mucor lusitanicus CBS 277.49]
MLNNCCFCINLRTATLVLAVLGAVTHLYGAMTLTALSDEFDDADTGAVLGLTAYSYLSGFACLAGAVGVLKNNVKHLRFFNAYYWADLGLHTMFSVASALMLFSLHTDVCKEIVSEAKDDEFDMNTCESVYIQGAWVVTIAMAINMLLKLHFAFAIHSYTKQVKQNKDDEELMDSVISTPYPTAYISTTPKDNKEQPIYVAGQEYIPDEKKQQQAEEQH